MRRDNLGCCYLDGEGTEVDLGKAGYRFERAAAKGHEDARTSRTLNARARLNLPAASSPEPEMRRACARASRVGLGVVVVAAFLSAPPVAVWCLAFLNAKPAWRKDDDTAEAGMEIDMSAMLGI
ncbi:hypothetical protein SO694_00028034 [Aureococcus anophagefferens]|uniref:Sel1 repeat family protein n=1 Tax=Aureococcus anophagefferens TaxID=44056 RepID=A0ABR1FVE7_AURAN